VDYFLYQADGIPTGDLAVYSGESVESVYAWLGENYGSSAQKAFLAYQAYLIDPLSADSLNTQYVSNASYSNPLLHTMRFSTDGKKSTSDIFIAGEFDKKLSVGISFAFKNLSYRENKTFTESGYDSNSVLQFVKYSTELYTDAEGKQLKFGFIYKFTPKIRLSFSYHSPQWWTIDERTRESLYSEAKDVDDLDNDSDTDEINVFDLYPGRTNVFSGYRYIVPGKWNVGAAYIVKKNGFLSFSYGYTDYSLTHFEAMDGDPVSVEYYTQLNDRIREVYTATHTFRAGGEFKMNDWQIRGGFFYQTSPFRHEKDMTTSGISFGLGYDFGNFEMDFGLMNSVTRRKASFFDAGFTNTYENQMHSNIYSFGLRYNF
jgi:hypothetical protein